MERDAPARPEDLLESQVDWVRALARRLARDADAAEDLAQETLVVALTEEPREPLRFRAWMATVMRNLLRQGARTDLRRSRREELAARPEATRATDALVEQVQLGRDLAQAVLDLAEPYRTTLLLRFWEELPPSAIARRLDVPVATVNSRIARGLAQLRERFDRERGGRASWLTALTPLLDLNRASPLVPALSLGGIVVNAKIVVSLFVVAALGVAWWSFADTDAADPVHDAPALASGADRAPIAGSSAPAMQGARNEGSARALAAVPAAGAVDPVPDAPMHSVRGRLLDAQGVGLGGVEVGAEPVNVRTAGAGWFEFETGAERLVLTVSEPGWSTVRDGLWRRGSTLEPVVVAARSVALAGTVVDPRGDPLGGVRVTFVLPSAFGTRFDSSLESSSGREWRATTGPDGRFELADAPAIEGARLRAVREGWSTAEIDAPLGDDLGIVFTLARPQIPLTGALRGRVVDPNGAPVAEARVFLGLVSTTTDEGGRFGLDLARAVTSDRILALRAGWRPASLERPREPSATDTGWPTEVVLVLSGPPLSIAGVVLGADGKPAPNVRVSLADPTSAGVIGRMPASAEALAAGAAVPPQAVESEDRMPDQDGDDFFDQYMRVGPPTALWHYTKADAEGRFAIGGLDDRRYRLRVVDTATLCAFETDPIEAGTSGARIRMPEPDLWPELLGAVTDDQGEPVPGVQIQLDAEAFGVRARILGGNALFSLRDLREKTRTDAEGRFRLAAVPRSGATLHLSGEGIVPRMRELAPDVDPANLAIEVAVRCSFEVRASSGTQPAPDAIALRDARGESLDVLRIEPDSVQAFTDAPLMDGRTGVLSASSAARTLVLMRDGQVVGTVPIRLRRGEPNVIDV